MKRRIAIATTTIALCALVGAVACAAGAGAATRIADSGFRPQPDGYSFPNYGDAEGYRDLTAVEMVKLYGKAVCSGFADGRCVLLPTARQWMETISKEMDAGHCEGFAVTAQAFFEGLDSPDPFGAPTVFGLGIDGNPPLQSHIAYGWAFQKLTSVFAGTIRETPRQVVERLRKALRPGHDPFVLGVRGKEGGHAITPIAVDRTGKGKRAIRVYDNNHPNETKTIHVDLAKDSWRYDEWGWSGQGHENPIKLEPFKLGLRHQPCLFCRPKKNHRGKLQLLWQGDATTGHHSDVLVFDRRGRRSGCSGNGRSYRCVNRISGVELNRTELGAAPPDLAEKSPPPTFRLPPRRRYQVKLNGRPLTGSAREGLAVLADGYAAEVENVRLRPRQRARLAVGRHAREVVFHSARRVKRPGSPRFELSAVGEKSNYELRIAPSKVAKGAALGLALRQSRGRLVIDATRAQRRARYGLKMKRQHGATEKKLQGEIAIRRGQVAIVHYKRWRHGSHPPVKFR